MSIKMHAMWFVSSDQAWNVGVAVGFAGVALGSWVRFPHQTLNLLGLFWRPNDLMSSDLKPMTQTTYVNLPELLPSCQIRQKNVWHPQWESISPPLYKIAEPAIAPFII